MQTTTQQGVTEEAEILEANQEAGDQEAVAQEAGERPESDRERLIREMSERRFAELREKEESFTEQAGSQPGIEDRFPEAPQTVRIKVDGEERDVPLSDVIEQGTRTLQKESTADKRLKEASEMRQAAELRALQVDELARQLQAQQEQNQERPLSREDAVELKQQAR